MSAPSIAAALGLSSEDEQLTQLHAERLAEVASAWPVASLMLLVTAGGILASAILGGMTAALPAIGAAGGMTLLAGALIWLVAGAGMAAHWSTALRLQLVAGCSVALGGALIVLLWIGTRALATHDLALVAIAGTMGVVMAALHSARIAMLAFAAGLAFALAVLADLVPAAAGGLCLVGLALAVYRLSRADAVTAHRRSAAFRQGQQAAKMIAEFEGQGSGWFWEADRAGRLIYLSGKVAAELGRFGPPPVGRLFTDVFRLDSAAPDTERTLGFHLSSRTSFTDYSVCAADDPAASRWWSISGRPTVDARGQLLGFIGSGSDLTERRKSEAEITRLALFDSLTGLANRQRMRLSLDQTLAQAAGSYHPAALFLMDLDRFKTVNDTLGHQAGDNLLKQVAQRLQRGVGDAGLVGRLGGDEFQVLLPRMDSCEALSQLARSLIDSLSQPYSVGGTMLTIGCSIGIAIAPQDGSDAETLIRSADLALYRAKGDGRGIHRFYSEEMLAEARAAKQLEDDLRIAVRHGALHLNYQPVVTTDGARISGYEALVRWNHPTRGAISPAEFIPVAEECGLIEAIGEWVLRTACNDAANWPNGIRVAVNVSPIQFANPAFPSLVTNALARSGLPPKQLELEITEGVFLDDSQSSDTMFKSLKSIGVRLALDDFGTGYSSLGYLRTAPFDKIKIDQSFVRGAAIEGNRNAAIIKAIVTLADTLGMETTAEGVEVQDEIELIRALGCSHIQGYVYGRPMPLGAVLEQLGTAGGVATANGHKVSRIPRTKVLRAARLAIGEVEGEVRIRDISAKGAMIDGIEMAHHTAGVQVLIELLEDQMFAAEIRWAKDGKVGLQFAEPFDMAQFNQPPAAKPLRRTA